MSEKIPISLRNSDLFLRPKFTDTNRKEIDINKTKDYVLEKGPSLGENNQFRYLHTFLCEKKDQNENQSSDMERTTRAVKYELDSELRSHGAGVAKMSSLHKVGFKSSNLFTISNKTFGISQDLELVPELYRPYQKLKLFVQASLLLPLSHPKRSLGTIRHDKFNKNEINFESQFAEENEQLVLDKDLPKVGFGAKSKHAFDPFDERLDNHSKRFSSTSFLAKKVQPFNLFKLNSYLLFSRIFLYKLNKGVLKLRSNKRDLANQSGTKSLTVPTYGSAFATLICSGISREFLFVSINLILFSVLAVVQRSHYGKSSFLTGRKEAYNILCRSKLPNIISSSDFSTAGLRQDLYKIIPKHLGSVQQDRDLIKLFGNEKQKHLVGIFLGRSDLHSFKRSGVKVSVENAWTPYTLKQGFGKHTFASVSVFSINKSNNGLFSFLQFNDGSSTKASLFPERSSNVVQHKLRFCDYPCFSIKQEDTPRLLSTEANSKLLSTNDLQKLAGFKDHLIQPWHCIRVCNTSNTKMVATRSLCESKILTSQADNNLSYSLNRNLSKVEFIYNDDTIKGFQYYLPFYKSSGRIFAETDTIPLKRDTVYFKNTSNPKISHKPELSSCTNLSESILKRCFYRYGLLVVSSSKKVLEQLPSSKEIDKSVLTRLQYLDKIKECSRLSENKSEHGALSQQGTREIKDSSALRDKMTIALSTDLDTPPACSSLASLNHLKKSSSISFMNLKRLEGSNPLSSVSVLNTLFCCKSKAFPDILVSNRSSGSSDLPRFYLPKNSFLKGLLSVVSELGFNQYLFILNKIDNLSELQNKKNIVSNGSFFSPRSSLVKHKLTQLNFSTFVQMRDRIRTSLFTPDSFVPNSSVSGYQFPELQDREIAYLFRKQALFHFHLNNPDNKTFFQKLFTQLTTAFRTFKNDDLVNQVLSTLFLTNQNGIIISQRNTRSLPESFLYQKLKNLNGIAYDVRTARKAKDCNKNEVFNVKSFAFGNQPLQEDELVLSNLAKQNVGNQPKQYILPAVSERVSEGADDIRMRYTQTDLDDIKNVKDLFGRLNRNYEEYLRQPKDSLPALIISPSLEDDLEIEEEGIRIFRKRDLIKNKKGDLEDKNIEQEFDSILGRSESISGNEMQNKEASHAYRTNRTVQAALSEPTHQLLVKKALRQAQEEIDNIAKKEEKGTEKDKQVIPPLTRLEALYTIRNRERKYEQAKEFSSKSVKTTSSLGRIASVLFSRVTFWKNDAYKKRNLFVQAKPKTSSLVPLFRKDLHSKRAKTVFPNSPKTKKGDLLSETRQTVKYTSLPIFEQLSLYSDKSNDRTLNELFTLSKGNNYLPYQSSSSVKFWHNRTPGSWIVTPWLFSKLGDENICTDRKHSFFGEMSLPSKRLSAQDQKQIFQQKANPLLKVNNQNTKPTSVSPFDCISSYELLKQNELLVNKLDKVSNFSKEVSPIRSTSLLPLPKQSFDTCENVNFLSVSNTVPLSLLSQFSVHSRPKYKKNEVLRFACKSKVYAVPKVSSGKTNSYLQKASLFIKIRDARADLLHAQRRLGLRNFAFTDPGCENKVPLLKALLTKQSFKELDTKHVKLLPDLVGIKNRIYFYDNLSQNKACQSSAPKVKNTALQSPVSHRIWQPKRMEASTFRISQRNKKTSVLPRISQKDWKNIMEWQLRKYFVEEDKRLLPLSSNNNKNLKIKKLHFYLPWISIKRPTTFLSKQALGSYSQRPALWPLTRLDLAENSNRLTDLKALLSKSSTGNEIAHSVTDFSKVEGKIKPKVVFRLEPAVQKKNSYQDKIFSVGARLSEQSCRSKALYQNPVLALPEPCSDLIGTPFRPQQWRVVAQSRLNTFALAEMQNLQNNLDLLKSSVCNEYLVDSQNTNYWRLPTQQTIYTANLPIKKRLGLPSQHKTLTECTGRNTRQISNRRSINSKVPVTKSEESLSRISTSAVTTQKKWGDYNKGINKYSPSLKTNQSILFESVTRYSCLFIYTFVFVLMFKQLFMFVYRVGLKDFFINFLNSEFGRTITSEEFRYSIQNSPLADYHMPKKRLQGLFGLERNKVQLLEIVWFLRNHCQGRHGIRGVLLVGPPGVENVSVVQAIAGEANVPIIVQSLEKIAQDSEPQRQLEQLYMRAHKQAPCVLFLDQLDTIGARRDQLFTDNNRRHNENWMQNKVLHQNSLNSLDHNSRDSEIEDNNLTLKRGVTPGNKLNVVLRLLTILDGITQSSGVVTVATARDITKLDPALLRPKRFDRRIYLSLPNRQDRVHLFKVETQKIGHIKKMPWDYLSLQTESMNAADIRSAINYSLFKAVLQNSVHTVETLEYGIDCVRSLTDKRSKKS